MNTSTMNKFLGNGVVIFFLCLILFTMAGCSGTENSEFDKEESKHIMVETTIDKEIEDNWDIDSDYLPRVNFGQLLEPKGNYILHGAGQGDNGIWESFDKYTDLMGSEKPLMTMEYVGLHHRYFDSTELLIKHLNKHDPNYILPQIGLLFNREEDPETAYDKDVANGEMDEDVRMLLLNLKRINRPIYLRIGHEFNGEWNGYTPEYYKKAFRRTHMLIEELEIKNIAIVWCYSPAAKDKSFMKYYPGDDVVDWWAIDIFKIQDVYRSNSFEFLKAAEEHKKPVMLSEATAYSYGTTSEESWEKWFIPYFDFIKNNPVIKAACYINWDWTKFPRWVNWGDARLELNKELAVNFHKEISDPIWFHASNENKTRELLVLDK